MRRLLSSLLGLFLTAVGVQAHADPGIAPWLVEGAPGSSIRPSARSSGGDPFAPTIALRAEHGRSVGSCLGVMVAPRVGLTAGHCVADSAKITVHAATTSGGPKVVAVHRFWVDPTADPRNGFVEMDTSDIAIIVLAEPLPMPAYARYAHAPIEGTVRATGIRNAPTVIEARGITLRPSSARYYASSTGFGKPGDSGAPVFVGEGDARVVVGILAGVNPSRDVFARVELVARKLDELVVSTSLPETVGSRTPPASPFVPPRPAPATPPKLAPPKTAGPPPNVTWT